MDVKRINTPLLERNHYQSFSPRFILKPNLMDEKTTLNDYLVYSFCTFCFLWSLYLLIFEGM